MKFSHRSFPVLKFIEQGSISDVGIIPVDLTDYDNHKGTMHSIWKDYCKYFGGRTEYLTKPFKEAISLSSKKMLSEELRNSIPDQSGVLLNGEITTCYYISDYGLGFVPQNVCIFQFFKNYLVSIYQKSPGVDTGAFTFITDSIENGKEYFKHQASQLFATLNFIKYAPIEVKELKGRKKLHDATCKYVNDTESNIRILDSAWFTSLVKSEGFKVRGHFRLQPCGQNNQDRKLIWISDFEKEGYTAHFKRPLNHPAIISTVWP